MSQNPETALVADFCISMCMFVKNKSIYLSSKSKLGYNNFTENDPKGEAAPKIQPTVEDGQILNTSVTKLL